ncbi:hypothetical protein [Desertihabitans aurantiacus]|uniref:hypothetical protein n=1 Tax=Desertihabitans aurantiacus TaxID=2282477 RepID=UPI000DF7519B|nr:hypothetical protein [Desertihabitans aurantiacus]
MSSYGNDPDPQPYGTGPQASGDDRPTTWSSSDDPTAPGVTGYGSTVQDESLSEPVGGSQDTGGGSGGSTKDVAQQEASQVAGTAKEGVQNVAGTAKEEAVNVAQEAKQRAGDIVGTVLDEVRGQASSQQQRLAGGLHTVASELGEMASKSEQSGPGTQLAKEASRRIGSAGHWLENREPADLLDEVRDFARRRPVVFLAGAALAGVVVGRLTRDIAASRTSLDDPGPRRASATGTGQGPAAWEAPSSGTAYGATGTTGYEGTGSTGYADTGYASGGYSQADSAGYGQTGASGYGTTGTGYATGSQDFPPGTEPGAATDRPASLVEEDLTDPQAERPGEDPWLDPRNEGTR